MTWDQALRDLLDALDHDFGPAVTRVEFEDGMVLVFGLQNRRATYGS